MGNAENGRSTFVGGGWVAKSSGAFLKFAPQTDTFRYSKFVRTPKYFCRPKVGRRVRTAQNRATRRFKKEAKSAPIPYENEFVFAANDSNRSKFVLKNARRAERLRGGGMRAGGDARGRRLGCGAPGPRRRAPGACPAARPARHALRRRRVRCAGCRACRGLGAGGGLFTLVGRAGRAGDRLYRAHRAE